MKKSVRKLQSCEFSPYCSDLIFFQSHNLIHGKFLYVKKLTLYALRYFQFFSEFHLNKLELSILLITEGGLFLNIDTFVFTMVSIENCSVTLVLCTC